MSNNLISLLLQCLDKFNGILFFCSNFKPRDFDPALNRRFHQIVPIKSPPTEIMRTIFQNRFPEFSDEDADEFIKKYRITAPAEIERLRKKHLVHLLVNEDNNTRNILYSVADQELADKGRHHAPLGFKLSNNNPL